MATDSPRWYEFIVSTLALLLSFAASAAPIPLYDLYHRTYNITYNELALTSVFYFVGAVSALLFLGRLSNHTGRKKLTLLVFLLCAFATFLFTQVHSALPLIVGRLLLGIACGLASSGITAYIVDTAPVKPAWLSATTVSITPLVGLTLGALSSGLFAEQAPYPFILCYIVIIFALAGCAALLFFAKESVTPEPGFRTSLRPRFDLPPKNKPFIRLRQ
ncbi:MFS transporter [Alteromonas halophila]|uniref:Major facilitator superfamily (MFS) profile domain-containing protein n=1 Tax=Alteromonas halophila TaxID=516698 RepID=A0A918N1H5_9ALTE|nr:MFS transporter [Alteromonas halophila]GGW93799.1 hypothetical protein GCM10007391_30120 [Alteromonas halophila]